MSDIQEALDFADQTPKGIHLYDELKTLAAAYREVKADLDKTYLDPCIKTRTAHKERTKRKYWFTLFKDETKKWAELTIKYARLLEVAYAMADDLEFHYCNSPALERFQELIK